LMVITNPEGLRNPQSGFLTIHIRVHSRFFI